MIHIHKYHDLSNGVVIFCVMGRSLRGVHSRKMAPQGDECYSSLISSGHQYRFVELFYLFISMGWGYLSCCHNLKSFHSSPFHFFSLFVILLALTNGRFCQGDANHCCTFKTTGNSIIESIHVVREKTLADGSQTSNFLIAVSYNLCLTNGGCRFVL